jgi:hypothetical protein
VSPGATKKLDRLIGRLVSIERRRLTDDGRTYLTEVLRWRLRLRTTKPHLPGRGRPIDVVRYERTIIEQRADTLLKVKGVRDEIEAVNVTIR